MKPLIAQRKNVDKALVVRFEGYLCQCEVFLHVGKRLLKMDKIFLGRCLQGLKWQMIKSCETDCTGGSERVRTQNPLKSSLTKRNEVERREREA